MPDLRIGEGLVALFDTKISRARRDGSAGRAPINRGAD
jgi:hypothetical protein